MNYKNKGMSYIELVLVMGIAGLLIMFVTFSVATVSRNNCSKGAKKLENAFATAQAMSMAKGKETGRLYIIIRDNKCSYIIGSQNFISIDECKAGKSKNENVLFTKPCTLRINMNGVSYYPVVYGGSGTEVYSFTFEPTTGAIFCSANESLGSPSYVSSNKNMITGFEISNGNTDSDVKLYTDTGRAQSY